WGRPPTEALAARRACRAEPPRLVAPTCPADRAAREPLLPGQVATSPQRRSRRPAARAVQTWGWERVVRRRAIASRGTAQTGSAATKLAPGCACSAMPRAVWEHAWGQPVT